MPGGYEYLYLDHPTYLANQAALANDPEGFNLSAYPSMDMNNSAEVADPYDPTTDVNGKVRYPLRFGFDLELLQKGNATAHSVARPFADPAIAAKFFNIRGVQSRNGQILNNTCVGQAWAESHRPLIRI